MSSASGWQRIVLAVLLGYAPSVLGQVSSYDWLRERDSHEDEEVITALYACFRQGVEEGLRGTPVDFGPASEVFFSEQLARAVQTLGDAPRLAWCQPWFVEPYLRARHALTGPGGRKGLHSHHHTLATSLALDAEGQVVVLASQDVGGSHVLDHAKMTQEALWARPVHQALKGLGLGRRGQVLLVQAAEVPDLYQFGDDGAHARAARDDRDPERALSQEQFVQYVVARIGEAQSDLQKGETSRGLVRLGMVAHAAQDLVLRRGLTHSEEAALAFAAGPLADVGPAAPIAPDIWDQAVHATSELLAAALGGITHAGVAPEAQDGDNAAPLGTLVAAILGRTDGADFTELRQFWRVGWAQRRGRGEHLDPSETPRAVGPWNVEATLAAIVAAL